MKKQLITIGMIVSMLAITPMKSGEIVFAKAMTTQAVTKTLKTPTVSKKSGTYTNTVKITIKNPEKKGKLYYTIDGKTPTKKSTLYTKAITIKKSCTLKVICINGTQKSAIVTRKYTIKKNQTEENYDWTQKNVATYVKAIKENKIEQLGKVGQEICKTAKEVIRNEIKTGMTREEKAKAIHDYIVNTTSYDIINYQANTIPESSYRVEGVLLKHVAVCNGYAETYQMFMELLDIPNKFVVGKSKRGGGHAWNMIQLSDGKWYHVDTTWDDPITYTGEQELRYNYLFASDSIMKGDHTWNQKQYPTCNGNTYLYYGFENKLKSITEAYDIILNQYQEGKQKITVLYPENKQLDTRKIMQLVGVNSIICSTERLGEYTVFTVEFNCEVD